jgi:hypothetical protein
MQGPNDEAVMIMTKDFKANATPIHPGAPARGCFGFTKASAPAPRRRDYSIEIFERYLIEGSQTQAISGPKQH